MLTAEGDLRQYLRVIWEFVDARVAVALQALPSSTPRMCRRGTAADNPLVMSWSWAWTRFEWMTDEPAGRRSHCKGNQASERQLTGSVQLCHSIPRRLLPTVALGSPRHQDCWGG